MFMGQVAVRRPDPAAGGIIAGVEQVQTTIDIAYYSVAAMTITRIATLNSFATFKSILMKLSAYVAFSSNIEQPTRIVLLSEHIQLLQ